MPDPSSTYRGVKVIDLTGVIAGPMASLILAGLGADVVFTGSVPWDELPAHYDAGDVFAMPCRSRALARKIFSTSPRRSPSSICPTAWRRLRI